MTDFELQDIKNIASLDYDWSRLDGKTLLISGGTGFIGRFLINVFKYRNAHFGNCIRIVSLSRRGGISDADVEYVSADVTKPIAIDKNIDYVLHLASNTHPAQYAADPVGTVTTNVLGTHNLLEFAVKAGVTRFLLASSVEIYGDGDSKPMCEDYCGYIDCNTVRAGYNESKRVSESLCQAYIKQYGLDCVIARLARCFGADKKADSKAIAQFMSCALDGRNVVLKSEGKQRYSYCYVADAASGIIATLLNGECGNAYNISDDDEGKTLGDYARLIASLGNVTAELDLSAKQPGASVAQHALVDTTKIKAVGFKPVYTVSDALKRTYAVLKTRE